MKWFIPAAVVFAATATHAQPALDANAALSWYSGVTVEGTTWDGNAIHVYHSASGMAKGLIAGKYSNDGPWKVREDGAVCVDWRDSAWGKNPCYWIKEDSGGYWKLERVDNAKNFIRVLRVEGNKYNM